MEISLTETWVNVVDDPRYKVSSLGRILGARGWILKPRDNGKGYLVFYLGGGNAVMVSHIVARAFIGPRPEGHEVAHKNGIRTDNRACNLHYLTPSANAQEKKKHGTHLFGETAHRAKLKETEVIAMRQRYRPYSKTDNFYSLAREFGVTPSTVREIITRQIWAHLP